MLFYYHFTVKKLKYVFASMESQNNDLVLLHRLFYCAECFLLLSSVAADGKF